MLLNKFSRTACLTRSRLASSTMGFPSFLAGLFSSDASSSGGSSGAGDPVSIATSQQLDMLLSSKSSVLIDFTASWCGPCRMLAPILAKVMKDYPSVAFAKVDIDEAQDLARRYNVSAVPTVILYKDGKEANKFMGAKNAEGVRQFLTGAGLSGNAKAA